MVERAKIKNIIIFMWNSRQPTSKSEKIKMGNDLMNNLSDRNLRLYIIILCIIANVRSDRLFMRCYYHDNKYMDRDLL